MIKKNMNKKTIVLVSIVALVFTLMPFWGVVVKADTEIFNINVKPQYNEVNINWYTDKVLIGELRYGLTDNNLAYKMTSSTLTDWHNYTVKGLIPGTVYNYSLVAKDKNGVELSATNGTFETWGTKPQSQVFWQFFYLNFDNSFYSPSNKYPSEILNVENLKLTTPAIGGKALKVLDKNSNLIYNAENIINPSYGTVLAMVRFENFNKNMVIWQTDDSKYALYFEHGNGFDRLVARAGYDNKKTGKQEAYYYFNTTGSDKSVWKAGEWHQVGITWNGVFGGTVKIYVDGEVKDQANFTNGGGASTFMIGNNYRNDMNWSEGQIDDFKIFSWDFDSTAMRNESNVLALNTKKDVKQNQGKVAGAKVRYFKTGKLVKTPDNKVYVIGRNDAKIHITDILALNRFGNHPIVSITFDELAQYTDSGEFSTSSNYPDGTLLKGSGPNVYWVWNGKKGLISDESVFYRYGNIWADVITISDIELDNYTSGLIYY